MQARFSPRMDRGGARARRLQRLQNAYVAPPPPKVVVAQPLTQPVTLYLNLTGNTSPIDSVDLVARVQGFLTDIDYVDGAAVKAGDKLFGIERDQYQAQLDQAKATLASNQATLTYNQADISARPRWAETISLARPRSRNGNRKPSRRRRT